MNKLSSFNVYESILQLLDVYVLLKMLMNPADCCQVPSLFSKAIDQAKRFKTLIIYQLGSAVGESLSPVTRSKEVATGRDAIVNFVSLLNMNTLIANTQRSILLTYNFCLYRTLKG